MAVEEKKRKHKDNSEKSQKKKQKSAIKIVEPSSPASSVSSTSLNASSSFSETVIRLYLHLAPMWSGKTMEGVNEQLNAFLMKYVPEVDGIVLAHSDVKFDKEHGRLLNDSPFAHFFITAKFLVWKPKKGTKLVGRINLQSEDHIGLLIYGTFNASIPKSRITSAYEWKVNEEEADVESNGVVSTEENTEEVVTEERKRTQYGEWVDKATGASIGGEDGTLEFTVIDIIEANDILTVNGSL